MRHKKLIVGLLVAFLLLLCAGIYLFDYFNLIPEKYYTSEYFEIETVQSSVDYNGNGIDDYTDILLGARQDAENKPRYDGAYHEGGYPPENAGVCTDVIWHAFANAGYSLKDMIDKDISENTELYPRVDKSPDPNIDFRRVPNLKVFFGKYAVSLTTDPNEIEAWQPGDIVIYGENHIAIVSDRRNKDGIPYIIHNAGQPVREENALDSREVSGHFRFDTSKIADSVLIAYNRVIAI